MPKQPKKTNQTTYKIHALIAKSGYCSRRKAEELITLKKVRVNGALALLGQRATLTDVISINGKVIANAQATEKVYFVVNKPVGVVSSTRDRDARTVLSLLPPTITKKYRLFPVGRLDKDSQGLIILTNDGDLTYRLTHPKFKHAKTYEITVNKCMTQPALNHLERGVKLKDGYAKPDSLEILERSDDGTVLKIVIHEGRHHQIRRMMQRVGYNVTTLERTAIGNLELDWLGSSQYKEISFAELQPLISL